MNDKLQKVDRSMTTNDTGSECTDKPVTHKTKDDLELEVGNSSNQHIKNIDLYDRMNFKRIIVKRSSTKSKTNIVIKSKLNIEKFSDEIIKYVEDVPEVALTKLTGDLGGDLDRPKRRAKTIKFASQKVTYSYAKTKDTIKSNFSDSNTDDLIMEEDDDEEDNKNKINFGDSDNEKQEEGKNIFSFNNEDEDSENKEEKKQCINLHVQFDEK
jgi:hypothetical protein